MSKYHFFWESASPFSNWYKPNDFIHQGVSYNCSEQAMMHKKALLFGDTEVAQLIMEQTSPRLQKALGREVRGFDKETWDDRSEDIVTDILVSKFTSTPSLKKYILDTGDKVLVEASPYDTVWGIGLKMDHPDAQDESTWRGENRLGNALMKAREIIREIG